MLAVFETTSSLSGRKDVEEGHRVTEWPGGRPSGAAEARGTCRQPIIMDQSEEDHAWYGGPQEGIIGGTQGL